MHSEKLVLPEKKSETYGVWLERDNTKPGEDDVHIYVNKLFGVVIGHNKDVDTLGFTELALTFSPEGRITLQYNSNGEPKHVDVEESHIRRLLHSLLKDLKAELT